MHSTRHPASVTVFHRVDDPWSYLLLQALPQLSRTYSIAFRFVTVPWPAREFASRPEMLLANGLRDCADLARHYDLDFPLRPQIPSGNMVDLATRMLLAQPDPDSYLDVAVQLGKAIFRGLQIEVDRIVKNTALPTTEAATALLEQAAAHQLALGHYHSAMVLFEGGWYWGIDRLYHLEQALIALGHRRPSGIPGCPAARPAAVAAGAARSPVTPREVPTLRFYCSFRSPYAYLAAGRVFDLQRRYNVRVDPRLIIPMKMAGFAIPEAKASYFRFDCAREALRHGIRFGRFTDPFGSGLLRAMAVYPHAASQGKAEGYILSVMEGVWADGLDLAVDEDLANICRRSGLDASTAMTFADPATNLSWADRHRDELATWNQYAAPVFVLGDYMTWGQDRLPLVEKMLEQTVGRRERY